MPRKPQLKFTDAELRARWLQLGLNDIRDFGFPDANAENIFTDYVYSHFFGRALKEGREASAGRNAQVDRVIDGLLADIVARRQDPK